MLTLLPRVQANAIKKFSIKNISNSLLNYTRSASSKLNIDPRNRLREIQFKIQFAKYIVEFFSTSCISRYQLTAESFWT